MKSRILVLAAAATLALGACSTGAPAGGPSEKAAGSGTTKVSVAFYPLEFAVTKAAGDKVKVSSLTLPGTEPHDLEITPQQTAELQDADLVVYLKGFQPAVDAAIEQSSTKNVLDVSQVVELHAATEADHDHNVSPSPSGEATSTSSEEEGNVHDHDHGTLDPHFWLDPTLEAKVIDAVAAELADIDTANAETFQNNAKAAVAELTSLDNEYKTGLSTCSVKTIITSHAAFGYLTERYGLEQVGISGISPNERPSPARIAEVQDLAQKHGVTTIFFETLSSDADASAVAGDLGLELAVLDPIEGITDTSPGTDYVSVMKSNLEALKKANACS